MPNHKDKAMFVRNAHTQTRGQYAWTKPECQAFLCANWLFEKKKSQTKSNERTQRTPWKWIKRRPFISCCCARATECSQIWFKFSIKENYKSLASGVIQLGPRQWRLSVQHGCRLRRSRHYRTRFSSATWHSVSENAAVIQSSEHLALLAEY